MVRQTLSQNELPEKRMLIIQIFKFNWDNRLLICAVVHLVGFIGAADEPVTNGVELQSPTAEYDLIQYCPDTYYYFRCEVKQSLYQFWLINGIEEERYVTNSVPFEERPREPLNFLLQSVTPFGGSEEVGSYISYLWFNSRNNVTSVTCGSDEYPRTIRLEPATGGVQCLSKDSGLTCSSEVNNGKICYGPNEYYFFRCKTTGLLQVWIMDGTEIARFTTSTIIEEVIPEEPFNIFIQHIISGDGDDTANFVSYVFFNSSNFNNANYIGCGSSSEQLEMISFDAECGWPTPVVSSTAQTPTVIPTTSPTPTQTGLEGRYAACAKVLELPDCTDKIGQIDFEEALKLPGCEELLTTIDCERILNTQDCNGIEEIFDQLNITGVAQDCQNSLIRSGVLKSGGYSVLLMTSILGLLLHKRLITCSHWI